MGNEVSFDGCGGDHCTDIEALNGDLVVLNYPAANEVVGYVNAIPVNAHNQFSPLPQACCKMSSATVEHMAIQAERADSKDQLLANDEAKGAVVRLNVYHLNDSWCQSNHVSNQIFGIGGAFHAGIEVHGKEWSYGNEGITCSEPQSHQVHVFHESIPLGETDVTLDDVLWLIEELQIEWRGEDYNMLENNCCNFSDALSQELVGESIPAWVLRFPAIASQAAAHLEDVIDVKQFVQDLGPNDDDMLPTYQVGPKPQVGRVAGVF